MTTEFVKPEATATLTTAPAANKDMIIGWFSENLTTLATEEAQFNSTNGLVTTFCDFNTGGAFPLSYAQAAKDRGSALVIQWEPFDWNLPNNAQPAYAPARITAGDFDSYIESFFLQAEVWTNDESVLVVFAPEMNDAVYPWSGGYATPAQYIAMWKHVYNIKKAVAPNVWLIWNPINFGASSYTFEQFWPGAQYVDALGINGFNWSDQRVGSAGWQDSTAVFGFGYADSPIARIKALAGNLPWGIGMTGSAPDVPADFQPGGKYYDSYGSWVNDFPSNPPYEATASDWITQEGYMEMLMRRACDAGASFVNVFHVNKETDWRLTDTSRGRQMITRAKAWNPRITTRDNFVKSSAVLKITAGKVRLDENYSPYVMATFSVPLTSAQLLEQIDPRETQRVTVEANEGISGTERTYDLGIRSRTVNHRDRTIEIEAASDEILLHDRLNVSTSVNSTPRGYETSLRNICEWALAQVPTIPRNLEPNPRALSSGSSSAFRPRYGWTIAFVTSSTAPSALPFDNIARLTSIQTGSLAGRGFDSYGSPDSTNPGTTGSWIDSPVLTPGDIITISRYVRSNAGSTRWRIRVRFHDGEGNWIGASVNSANTAASSTWARPFLTTTVPDGAKYMAVHTTNVDALDWTTSSILDMTGIMTEASAQVRPWKDQALAPGTADMDLTASWDATNLMTNPTAGIHLEGWAGMGGTASRLSTGTFPPNTSLASAVRVTMNEGEGRGPYFNGGDVPTVAEGKYNVSIREKQLYRVSAYIRTSAPKTLRLGVQQRNSAGAIVGKNLHSANFVTTANTWHRLTFVFQAYPGAATVGVFSYLNDGVWNAGQTIDITGVIITEGTLDHTYFDGGTIVRPDLYSYSWNEDAHVSTSERRAHVVRRPELFDWTPGQSLFEFLQPLLNMAGLRLFCDENRVWRLVKPEEYDVPGYVVAQGGYNTTEGADIISRNDDTWADAVVVKYAWTDANGFTQTRYDAAGDPTGKAIFRELEREYPGPGAAQHILNSYTGRGRVQSVTALGQYAATPGQDVTINLPGTLTQTGKVRSVTFDLRSGLMDLETRGLTDVLSGAWATWNPTETWAEVSPTLLWKDA